MNAIKEFFDSFKSSTNSNEIVQYIFQEKSSQSNTSLISITELLKSEDFKFWIKTGLSTLGLVISFYGMYKVIENLDMSSPAKRQKADQGRTLLKKLGIDSAQGLSSHELMIASSIVDSQSLVTDWTDIGGLASVVEELSRSVLAPICHSQDSQTGASGSSSDMTISSKLYRPPKGMLIYGPPGCGKTMLVRAMAKATNARFINLQTSTITDMYFGESEKYIEAIFSLANKIQPVIIFIDEIDGLMSSRSKSFNQESFLSIKTTFMSLWDGILTNEDSKILIVGASNRPNSIDEAILRRLQVKIEVKLPNELQRHDIFKVILKTERLSESITDHSYSSLANMSEGLSGSSIKDVCHDAVLSAVDRFKKSGLGAQSFVIEEGDIFVSLDKYKSRMERMRIY